MTVTSGATPSRGAAFRAAFRARIEGPVARVFIRTHLTPNMLTLIGFAIAVIGAWLAAIQLWLIAGVIVAFGAVFDLFDGALARATGKSSKLGAFLDSTFDRAGEAVVYIGIAAGCLAAGFGIGALLAATALAASSMVSYTRAKSESLGFSSGTGMANVGLAPREVRIALLSLGLIALGFVDTLPRFLRSASSIGPFSFDCPDLPLDRCDVGVFWAGDILLGSTLAVIAILATITTIQRILFVYQQSTKQEVTR